MALQQGFTEDASGNTVVSGTVSSTQSGTWTVQPGNTANTTAWKVDGSAVTQPVSAAALPLPAGASTSAKQPALGTAGTASADVISIQGIASMTPIQVTSATSSVATLTNVAGSATSVLLLASNASRKGMMFYNDSTSVAYVNFGATASTSAFTMKLQPNSYYENGAPVYTGALNIIWASATGSARVTELT